MSGRETNDYVRYRGKCKEMSEALIVVDPSLRLVRGYYHDLFWGRQQHWWCVKADGTIVDPTKDQFPTKGAGCYEEFDGSVECEYCGKSTTEDEACFNGHHVYCSGECCMRDVM